MLLGVDDHIQKGRKKANTSCIGLPNESTFHLSDAFFQLYAWGDSGSHSIDKPEQDATPGGLIGANWEHIVKLSG